MSLVARRCCLATLACLSAWLSLECAREVRGPSATERGDAGEVTRAAPEPPEPAASQVEAGESEHSLGAPEADASPADASPMPRRLVRPPFQAARDAAVASTPAYERVKTDESCGLESLPASYVHQTCCNGEPCRGECVRFKGQKKPVCFCADLVGGCPAPHHCCRLTHCTWVDRCLPH